METKEFGKIVKYYFSDFPPGKDMGDKLFGLIPPLLTPFTKRGEVDTSALKRLIDFVSSWVHGLFICGTYGQGPLMSIRQRKKVAETVIEYVKSGLKIIVHVGATDTFTAVELARHASDIGAYAVACVPPYYYKHREEFVIEHYRKLVSAVSIPVYVYNNPGTVGYSISPQLLSRLEEMGVCGVKDSSFDMINYMDYVRFTSDDFDVVLGTEALLLPGYVLGARAFIAGMSNYYPELVMELFKACESGEWTRARELQYRVLKIREIAHSAGSSIAGSYVILKLRGVDVGYPLPPILLPPEEKIIEMKEKLVNEGMDIDRCI